MDFAGLPPEINSARMYSGPGSGPMMAAAAAWDGLASELQSSAAAYSAAISGLTAGAWLGPASQLMAAAAAPYAAWMASTAIQAGQAGAQAKAAAGAYEAAFAMTVPPPVVAANRSQLLMLVATNILGQNAAAIAATEAQYAEMWAQDVAAMESYASSAAAASTLTPFTQPPQTSNTAAAANQANALAQAAAAAAGGGRKSLTFIELGEFGGLDALVAAGVGLGATNTSLSATNLGRQFNRDAIADAKGSAKPEGGDGGGGISGGAGSGLGIPGLGGGSSDGTGLRSATAPSGSATARSGAVVTASAGRAPTVGTVSVPPSWAVPPEIRQLARTLPMNGAPPIVMQDGAENPYTGMALAGLLGTGLGGIAARGGSANVTVPKPGVNFPAATKAPNPAANIPTIPTPSIATIPTAGSLADANVAASLAATLAAIPGATIVVIPPPPASQ